MRSRDEESPADVADASDAQQLWRLLVTTTGGREQAPSVAIDTFRRLHDAGQPEPVDSALLLRTDRRWRRTSAHVLAGILASGILDNEQQDRLAEELLWPDKAQYVHPLGWLGGTFIEFERTSSPIAACSTDSLLCPHRSPCLGDIPTLPTDEDEKVWNGPYRGEVGTDRAGACVRQLGGHGSQAHPDRAHHPD